MKKCAVTIEAMAAANFSRDVLEEQNTFTGDLIDFETVIETPVDEEEEEYLKSRLINVEKFKKEYLKEYLKKRNHCDWLKIGKKETCGKRCEEFYCNTHSKCIKKGGKIPQNRLPVVEEQVQTLRRRVETESDDTETVSGCL